MSQKIPHLSVGDFSSMSKKLSPSAGAFCIIKKEVRGMEM
jgi:hypothetical protein